ncbi:hypothetical protein GC093_01295 [Paenibacillus sp. LMG 31456]|uniref:Uncharacterized protein n=1 Tax=Paenibacillus foliorum TaxID=2654974 RepID=A0A972GSD0_9BACL|nr:hypothetical protein [Paenibacillus foliorum]NOU91875.1 hypothetical protein [Paenibacillus foliorum]
MTLIIVTMLAALIGTLLVGFSKKNKAGDPSYDRQLVGNWGRLGVYYIAMTVILVVLLVFMLRS